MINWKVVVGSGAIALFLSLLTGIIAGVSFGTLAARAVLWGVVFCAIGAGISFLVSKYLPELFTAQSAGNRNAPQQRQTVDIVLPDENPHDEAVAELEEVADDGSDAVSVGSADRREKSGPAVREPPRTVGDDLVEEVEEMEEDAVQPSRRTGRDDAEDGEGSELPEDLPEIDDEEPDFSSSGEAGGFQPRGVADLSDASGRASTRDILGREVDSEQMAKAIRTALRKDQKG